MSIGYACMTLGVPEADFKSCILKNYADERLIELISHNLNSLEHIIDYNIACRIMLFRITSDLIPFGSSAVNNLNWWDIFKAQFDAIGEKLKNAGIRVSMHPGQYTVLNSTDENVVERAVKDLNYHARVLDALNTNAENKIILHIGGVYGDKVQAMQRFEENYKRLEPAVQKRLVIENDDKSYTIEDVVRLGTKLGIPVVYDNLHNLVNPVTCPGGTRQKGEAEERCGDVYWIEEAGKTWKEKDGRPKIHYAQQDAGKRPGSHSETIDADQFLAFYNKVKTRDIDIMLEVKDKNLSAIKCMNLISVKKEIRVLEQEWSKYKYAVLERSPLCYQSIRALLREKSSYPAISFYRLIEDAMKSELQAGNAVNAAEHVWGYFKDCATDSERREFFKNIEEYQKGRIKIIRIKKHLWKLTKKYKEPYLQNSYYFLPFTASSNGLKKISQL